MIRVDARNIEEVRNDFKKLYRILQRTKAIDKVAADARNIVVERSLRGKDVNRRPFVPYSEKPIYMAPDHRPKPKGGRRKSKLGNRDLNTIAYDGGYAEFARKTKRKKTVNLFASGDMFRSFQAQPISPLRAIVAFTRNNPALKALANNRRREFVGIHEGKELQTLQKTFEKIILTDIAKAGF